MKWGNWGAWRGRERGLVGHEGGEEENRERKRKGD